MYRYENESGLAIDDENQLEEAQVKRLEMWGRNKESKGEREFREDFFELLDVVLHLLGKSQPSEVSRRRRSLLPDSPREARPPTRSSD